MGRTLVGDLRKLGIFWGGVMKGHSEGIKLGLWKLEYRIGNDARVKFWRWCGNTTLSLSFLALFEVAAN